MTPTGRFPTRPLHATGLGHDKKKGRSKRSGPVAIDVDYGASVLIRAAFGLPQPVTRS
jgi:hypothetical protein